MDVGSASWWCPSFCSTICWTERDSTDSTHGIFTFEVTRLAWHKCEESTGSRVCLPTGIPQPRGKKRQQMWWCGPGVCSVDSTAAHIASLNDLCTSALGPDLILHGCLTLSMPPLQLPFKDEVLGSWYKLVLSYGHGTPLTSPASSHRHLNGGVLKSFGKLRTFTFSE